LIGIWKMLGVIAILVPGFKLLKEWAYAGLFFTMTGAVISHIASNDIHVQIIAPFVLAIFTVLSWYLRPASRKIIPVNHLIKFNKIRCSILSIRIFLKN